MPRTRRTNLSAWVFLTPFLFLLALVVAGCSGGGSGGTVATRVILSQAPPAESLRFLVQPTNSILGQPIAPAVQVEVLGQGGTRIAYTGMVTLFLQAHASQAVLVGTLTVQAVAGVATFNDARVAGVGTGFRLVASGAGTPPVTSNPFAVTLEGATTFPDMALLHPTGRGPTDLAVADFDGDGIADFAVANAFDDTVSVRLGTPDGHVARPSIPELSTWSRPVVVLAGDVTGNGHVDLLAGHRSSSVIRIWEGNGDGTFGSPTDLGVPSEVRGGFLADLNADGSLDMVLAFPFSNTAQVYLNDGAGVFNLASTLAGNRPVQVAVAQLNGDTFPDVVVTNDSTNGVTVHFGDGTGQFPTNASFASGARPRHTLAADLDMDGNTDLVVSSLNSSDLTILMGDGTGSFTGSTLAAGQQPYWTDAADFDGDGHLDLVAVNRDGGTARILLGDGTGAFTQAGLLPAGASPHAVAAVDFNHDGRPDLVVVAQDSGGMGLIPNLGEASFASWRQIGEEDCTFVVARDFTGNGHLDLVVSERNQNRLALREGNGDGTFGAPAYFATSSRPQEIVVGDFNGSGHLDLAVTAFNSNQVNVLLNDGAGNFASAGDLATLSQPFSLGTADLNGDGNMDLAVSHRNAGTVRVFYGDGTGGFPDQEDLSLAGSSSSVTLRLGDVTGNSRPDIVVGERWGGSDRLSVFENTGSGFVYRSWFLLVDDPRYLVLSDLNLDGLLDAVVSFRNGDDLAYASLLSTGSAFVLSEYGMTEGLSNVVHSLEISDLNGDGIPDLVGTDQGGTLLLYLGVGGGRFVPFDVQGSRLLAGANPFHVAVGDWNGDGRPDFAVANHQPGGGGSGGISILLTP